MEGINKSEEVSVSTEDGIKKNEDAILGIIEGEDKKVLYDKLNEISKSLDDLGLQCLNQFRETKASRNTLFEASGYYGGGVGGLLDHMNLMISRSEEAKNMPESIEFNKSSQKISGMIKDVDSKMSKIINESLSK